MNWEAAGAIGEIIGAVAVVVTLFYLAVQTRRNTSAVLNESARAAETALSEFNRELASDPTLLNLIIKSHEASADEFSSEEWHRFTQLARSWMHLMQMQYLQNSFGSAPSDQVASHLQIMVTFIKSSAAWKKFWNAEKETGAWLPGFISAVEVGEKRSIGSSGQVPKS